MIPHSEVELVHNPIGDGNCGFRALAFELFGSEGRYIDVKDIMLIHYLENIDGDYKSYDHSYIQRILNPQSNEWFCYPECAQIAADTFKTPIVFYSADSSTFFPLHITPNNAKRAHPIVLQLMHAHIILVKIKHEPHIQWPVLYPEGRGNAYEVLANDPWYPIYRDVFDRSIRVLADHTLPDDADIHSIHSTDSEEAVNSTK